MLHPNIIILLIILFLWSIITTYLLVFKNSNKALNSCKADYRAVYNDLDVTRLYCGSKNKWTPEQIDIVKIKLNEVIDSENIFNCELPELKNNIITCCINDISTNYDFWYIYGVNNPVASSMIFYNSLKKCFNNYCNENPSCKCSWNL